MTRHKDKYELIALTANRDIKRMQEQCLQWRPKYAVMADPDCAEQLIKALSIEAFEIEVLAGIDGLELVASMPETDYVMAAIVGAAGLLPTLAAARAGKRILLANKEALVMSGKLFMDTVYDNKAQLMPIDSEHNAVFQCMPTDFSSGLKETGVAQIMLTASGGPFWNTSLSRLDDVTSDDACAHPNWVMGRKISVDSATMMNKGLEVIEACWIFNTTPEKVQVVLHPQSVIHSLVEYVDGSVLAQLGNPDMRTPIAHALAWPVRIESGVERLDLFEVAKLDFQRPDMQKFPCLRLASEAMTAGGTTTTILNAANEVAVQEFLANRIRFTDISKIVELALLKVKSRGADSLNNILEADKNTREFAFMAIEKMTA